MIMDTYHRLAVYQRKHFKYDLIAGFVVFLVAIPLCLGIALASGAPLLSGIISGIIGGIIVGFLSGSQASISGPAAGMAAVVVTAITQLGDFNSFLLALMLAGFLQIVMGYFRAGVISDYIPSNVIQGLLCAIGILLIIKQLPLAFTHASSFNELKRVLLDTTEGFSLSPLLQLHSHINIGALIISSISLFILIFFERTQNAFLKNIPAPIVVVIAGIILNECFEISQSALFQGTTHLVNIPSINGFNDLLGQIEYPRWSAFNNPEVYLYAAIIAIVASLETLLNIKAIEKLDKRHRNCPTNRELFAQGVGNITAGLVGGIPITSVIVRTSVNIEAGSKSRISTILHGFFIATTVIIIPKILNLIPLSCLAMILIYTGYKLAKPAIFREIYLQGWDRFIPFIVTVVSIVTLNILSGILTGLTFSLLYILKTNSQARLDIIKEIHPNGVTHRLILPQQVSFLNKAPLYAQLNAIPADSLLIIDASHTNYIDKEILELIHQFKRDQAPEKCISINLTGFKDHYKIHNVTDFINVTTYDVQSTLTPKQVLEILYEGNQRFLKDVRIHRSFRQDVKHTATAQHPIAVVLGCIDSRVPVETIFDMTFGDIFCIRIAGNVINNDILASMEYACYVAKAKLIVVLGHTRCGAIQAACDGIQKGHITQLLKKIQPSVDAEHQTQHKRNSTNTHFVNQVINLNIANAMNNIYNKSTLLRELIDSEATGLVGAVYDVNSGKVHFKNYGEIIPEISEQPNPQLQSMLGELFLKTKFN